MSEITKELLDALKMATLQNQLDMLMTGEELRKCESAIAKAEAILAATQPDDGWIPWAGGDCPVGSEVVVTARFRFGGQITTPAKALKWFHAYDEGDIIAYRVEKP